MGQDILHDIPGCTGVGIYCIIDDVDGRKYIGQSINIFRRLLQHKAAMETGQCNAKITQAIMDGHTFHAKVLEELPASISHYDLLIKENEWITKENSVVDGFNDNPGFSRLDAQKKADRFKTWAGKIEELQRLRYDFKQKINPYSSIQQTLPGLSGGLKPKEPCTVKCMVELPVDVATNLCDMADRSGETIIAFIFHRLIEIAERDMGECELERQYELDFYKHRERLAYTTAGIFTLMKDKEFIFFLLDYLDALFIGEGAFVKYAAVQDYCLHRRIPPSEIVLALVENELNDARRLSRPD